MKTIYDHWIISLLFGAMILIGLRMIIDAFKREKVVSPPTPPTLPPTPPSLPGLPASATPPVLPMFTAEQGKAVLALVRERGVELLKGIGLLESRDVSLARYEFWRVTSFDTLKKVFGSPSEFVRRFDLPTLSEYDYLPPLSSVDYFDSEVDPSYSEEVKNPVAYQLKRGIDILDSLIEHLDLQAKIKIIETQSKSKIVDSIEDSPMDDA